MLGPNSPQGFPGIPKKLIIEGICLEFCLIVAHQRQEFDLEYMDSLGSNKGSDLEEEEEPIETFKKNLRDPLDLGATPSTVPR